MELSAGGLHENREEGGVRALPHCNICLMTALPIYVIINL
jgi:hypothetical protein